MKNDTILSFWIFFFVFSTISFFAQSIEKEVKETKVISLSVPVNAKKVDELFSEEQKIKSNNNFIYENYNSNQENYDIKAYNHIEAKDKAIEALKIGKIEENVETEALKSLKAEIFWGKSVSENQERRLELEQRYKSQQVFQMQQSASQQTIVEEEKEEDENKQEENQDVDGVIDKEDMFIPISVKSIIEEIPKEKIDLFDLESDKNPKLRGATQYDSRVEVNALNPNITAHLFMLIVSNSVGMIVEKEKITKISKDYYQLDTSTTLQMQYQLCDDVAFNKQPIVGAGTAFIVDANKMITASHVFQRPLKDYRVVFGYEIINKQGVVESIIPKSNIYELESMYKKQSELDISIFKIKGFFKGNKLPLTLGNSIDLELKHDVYMIGYPSGLPKKVAVNAGIVKNNHSQYFYTSLDSFQGNSGSPVFDAITNKVIGVLVSGEIDYIFSGNCYQLNSCRIPYCKGEKVIRIEEIIKQL